MIPTATEIRNFLDGYGISVAIIKDDWITARRDNFIIPYIEQVTRQSFSSIKTVTEYYSGAGKNILILDRRPILEVTAIDYVTGGYSDYNINLGSVEVILEDGILKSKSNISESFISPLFGKGEKNLKITYRYGTADMPADIAEACVYLCAEQLLGFIGARTGGGSVSVQGHSRSYGERGKYSDIRNDLQRQAKFLLSKYVTGIIG